MMTGNQIDYMLGLLKEKSVRLHDEHKTILKSKHLGMLHVNAILGAMETNNSLIVTFEKMKKEVDNGVLGLNH